MQEYQNKVLDLFKGFRPKPTYPVYPPYHKGPYLEDKFIEDFININVSYERIFIPISWTTVYCENKEVGLQGLLNKLDAYRKYFIVCQHDDAPKHSLPKDTLIFSASEHKKSTNPLMIPIPAICSKIPKVQQKEKDIFAGFVGSYTHEVRGTLAGLYHNLKDYYFSIESWNNVVSENRLNEFFDIIPRCKFSLCPRGYGNTSFRMYESMQMNSVPVYISDDFHLPWSSRIDWSSFCVMVDANEITNLDKTLRSISNEKYTNMLNTMKRIYNEYFTLEKLYDNITKELI